MGGLWVRLGRHMQPLGDALRGHVFSSDALGPGSVHRAAVRPARTAYVAVSWPATWLACRGQCLGPGARGRDLRASPWPPKRQLNAGGRRLRRPRAHPSAGACARCRTPTLPSVTPMPTAAPSRARSSWPSRRTRPRTRTTRSGARSPRLCVRTRVRRGPNARHCRPVPPMAVGLCCL